MLPILEELFNNLTSFLRLYSEQNHLPLCDLKMCLDSSSSSINSNLKNVTHLRPIVSLEFKRHDKQPFDIRLSFNSPQLDSWRTRLNKISVQLLAESIRWNLFQFSKTSVDLKLHCINIHLIRNNLISSLLSIDLVPVSDYQKTVVIQFSNQDQFYFTNKRMSLVSRFVENFLLQFRNCFQVFTVANFEEFVQSRLLTSNSGDRELRNIFQKLQSHLNSPFYDENNAKLMPLLRNVQLIESYLRPLIEAFGTFSRTLLIVVVSESEFLSLRSALDLVSILFSDAISETGQKFFQIKVIKVASVAVVATLSHSNLTNSNQICSFQEYKEMLIESLQIDEDISEDNLDPIVETMQSFFLLTTKLNSPITKLVHFNKESIFVQYNIARIKSIVEKFSTNYQSRPDLVAAAATDQSTTDFSLLQNDHEWNLILIDLFKLQQLNHHLMEQLLNDHSTDFDINKVIDQIKKLAQSFSCYYRNCKILTEPLPHLMPLIETRAKFCMIILNHLCAFFKFTQIWTVDQM